MTRTITLSDEHWQKISDALSDCYDEGPLDSPLKSSGLSAAQEALDAALAHPERPVQDDKTQQQMTDKQIRLDEGTMNIAVAQELKHRLEHNIAGLLHDYSVATNTTVRSIDLDTVSRLGDSALYVVTVEVHL